MSAAVLLTLYVTTDTARALLVFGVLHSGVELAPSSLTFGSELFKLLIAVMGVFYTGSNLLLSNDLSSSSLISLLLPYFKFAIPAALYGTNNVLYLTGLKITSPALLQVCVLSKLPLTALLHHIVIKRRRSSRMWYSLLILSFGLILAGSPSTLSSSSTGSRIEWEDLLSGPVIGLTVGVVSACSSVYTELALKQEIGFWQAQTYLYFWGTVFAGFAALISSSSSTTTSVSASLPAFSIVVTVTALTGLVVALILRQRDNLVKLVGSSLCITTVFILQHFFFPLTTEGLNFTTTFGIGILTLATWTYNHYKEIGDVNDDSNYSNYVELSTSEEEQSSSSSSSPALLLTSTKNDTPTPLPSCSDSLLIDNDTPSISTFPPQSQSPSPPMSLSPPPIITKTTTGTSNKIDYLTPTRTRLIIGFVFVLFISSLTSLQQQQPQEQREEEGGQTEREFSSSYYSYLQPSSSSIAGTTF